MALKPQEQNFNIDELRETWKTLYTTTLPHLARSKDSAQARWPVSLDHCFARIILDNTVGGGEQQWDKVLAKPALKSMSTSQLQAAIELGKQIKMGKVDLVRLDRQSLQTRGKHEGKYGGAGESARAKKRKHGGDDVEKEDGPRKQKKKQSRKDGREQSTLLFMSSDAKEWKQLPSPASSAEEHEVQHDNDNNSDKRNNRSQLEKELNVTSELSSSQTIEILRNIQNHTSLTPFRRRLYTALLSVPKGRYTTYAALAEHLGSAARAVGNGMRNNPFAPDVPCHRVLASDGTLGGYGGDWGREGKYLPKQEAKVKLLSEEGVKFDSSRKVKGPVWKGFWDLRDFEREYGTIS